MAIFALCCQCTLLVILLAQVRVSNGHVLRVHDGKAKLRSLDKNIPPPTPAFLPSPLRDTRKGVKLILAPSFGDGSSVFPLPADHLPYEFQIVGLGGALMRNPEHQRFVRHTIYEHGGSFGMLAQEVEETEASLVGAVGCMVRASCFESLREDTPPHCASMPAPLVYLQGKWRFIVKEVLSTVSYPVVLADELLDDKIGTHGNGNDVSYVKQSAALTTLLLNASKRLLCHKCQEPMHLDELTTKVAALEYVSRTISSLFLCDSLEKSSFCVSMLAIDLANLPNERRRALLAMTDPLLRMRLVFQELNSQLVGLTLLPNDED